MDVSIVTSGHDLSDARLHRLTAALRRERLDVEVAGLGDPADAPSGVRVVTHPRRGVAGRLRLAVSYAARAHGRVILALDPDSLIAATAVARLRGRRVVADVHEDYAALLGDRSWASGLAGRAAAVLVRAASYSAAHADLTLVADDHVPPARARQRLVVPNLPDPRMLPDPDDMVPDSRPRAVYIGDLRESRGLFSMLEAVQAAEDWHLDLVGPVAPGDAPRLEDLLASDPALAARVTLHGRRPPEESWLIARGAWAGLCLLHDTPAFREAMPSKIYEYAACGLPVLTTDLPRPAAYVREHGIGSVVPARPAEEAGAAAGRVLAGWSESNGLRGLRERASQSAAGGRKTGSPYDTAARAVATLVEQQSGIRRLSHPGEQMSGTRNTHGRQVARRAMRWGLAPDSPLRRRLPSSVKSGLRVMRRCLPDRLAETVDRAAGVDGGGSQPLSVPPRPPLPTDRVRLLVAPANFAGQGDAWARCARTHLGGVGSLSMMTDNKFGFPVDYEVTPEAYRNRAWQLEQRSWILEGFTHVLVEAERPVFGPLYGPTAAGDVAQLRKHGLTVGMISHGSDIRLPSAHAARFPFSPFQNPDDRTTVILEARAKQNIGILERFDGPAYVSTPDLLDYVPQAQWCPVVVNPDFWATELPVLERAVPRVVHVPSSSRMKGSELVDPIMRELAAEGLIEYQSVRDLTHAELSDVYKESDIVLDQFVLGLYGVAAAEGLAAGRVVVAYVTDPVRQRVSAATGLEVPITEADPSTVRNVVLGLLQDRESARRQAERGPAFVREVHDGRRSASVLRGLLEP